MAFEEDELQKPNALELYTVASAEVNKFAAEGSGLLWRSSLRSSASRRLKVE